MDTWITFNLCYEWCCLNKYLLKILFSIPLGLYLPEYLLDHTVIIVFKKFVILGLHSRILHMLGKCLGCSPSYRQGFSFFERPPHWFFSMNATLYLSTNIMHPWQHLYFLFFYSVHPNRYKGRLLIISMTKSNETVQLIPKNTICLFCWSLKS